MSFRQIVFLGGAFLAAITLFSVGGSLVDEVDSGHVHVIQDLDGEMHVRTQPGWYWQGGAKITDYPLVSEVPFGPNTDVPVEVIFNDSAKAYVTGNLQFRLPGTQDGILNFHTTYRSLEGFKGAGVAKLVPQSLRQTASLMKAEESYSSRSAEFTDVAREQLINGIYAKTSREVRRPNADGGESIERVVEIRVDDTTKTPVVVEESPFATYGVGLVQFTVTGLDYDEDTDKLINERKNMQQKQLTARAEAETAKQNAITEEEKGKALVAKAKAEKDVEKIAAVTNAQKEYEVAKYAALQAQEEAKQKLAIAKAEADGNRLKVVAGLTPQERAEWAYKTEVGKMEAFSKIQLPQFFQGGGGASGKGGGLAEALELDALMRIAERNSRAAAAE